MELSNIRQHHPRLAPIPRTKADAAVQQRADSVDASGKPHAPLVSFKVVGMTNSNPPIPSDVPVQADPPRDVVIVGGGLSGLTAMWKLKDKNAVLLESMDTPGGLAMHGRRDRLTYAKGAAYFTEPDGEILDLYKEIGLGSPEEVRISGPVDSYLADGKLVEEVWEEGLDKLPPAFRRFKTFMERLNDEGMIGQTPLEAEPEKVKALDKISAGQLLEPFGPEVKTFVDLYCRSALGTTSENISAMAFLNFYSDEMHARFAFPSGTGGVAQQLVRQISARAPDAIQPGAYVYDVHHRPDGKVEVRYQKDGASHAVLAREVVMAAQLSAATHMIKDLPEDRKTLFNSIEHSNYLVHNFFTPGTVYSKSYDTWVKGASFTDVIVGRWQETKALTVPGAHDGMSVLTVYQPLPKEYNANTLSDKEVRGLAERTLKELKQLFPRLNEQKWIDVETMRWPQSIHIVRPGLITEYAEELKKPWGHVFFAGNDLGVPSFEEAIYRGMQAASGVEKALASSSSLR